MNFAATTLRSIAMASLLVAGTAANALTINSAGLVANSVQAFSVAALKAFNAVGVTVTPLGNATAVAAAPGSFSFPITSITVNSKLAITGGAASGSALEIARDVYDEPTDSYYHSGVVVANFNINYTTKQVLADTTVGGATTAMMPLYNFNIATPLGLKYKFPLTITGHEILDKLMLTPEAKAAMTAGLVLEGFETPSLNNDFGTLTQDIKVTTRKAVSTTPYVAK